MMSELRETLNEGKINKPGDEKRSEMTKLLKWSFLMTGVGLICSPTFANSESVEVTILTEIKPVFQNGELTGCALNFQAGKNDHTYFDGDLALINGSLNLYGLRGKVPFYALKLGVMRNGEKTYVAPSTAFVVSDKASNKADFLSAVDAETPGFRLFTYSAGDATLQVMGDTTAKDKTIRIGYTMGAGSMSSIIPITLSMKKLNFENPKDSVLDDRAAAEWWGCNLNVIEAALKRAEAVQSKGK